jgi:Flp pilus assembly protein TadG
MMINLLRRFAQGRDANVAIIFALAMVPTIYLLGMGLDYASAYHRNVQLNAAADAAAIAAVTPAMMAQNSTVATTTAQNVFNATAATLSGLSATPTLSVTITNNGLVRNASVSYTATAVNNFPNILSKTTWALGGTSTASSTVMPNINFYLLLDSSPSMLIAGTSAGITTMVNNTSSQGGCAFACHESYPSADSLGNPGGEDNYALARNLGITLRIDLLQQATQNLMTTAAATEAANNNTYKVAIYTFDVAYNTIQTLTSNLTTAKNAASNIKALEVYDNNCLTSSNCNNDEDTNWDLALSDINTIMPNPGGGTNVGNDTPQEVLFIVTDGVEDENVSGTRTYQMSTAECTTIKNRGIRIAVLYTEYLPLPTNAWYNSYIAPIQSNIAPTMQACASPGLYFEVTSGGDISSAMTALFQQAVSTARLTQ